MKPRVLCMAIALLAVSACEVTAPTPTNYEHYRCINIEDNGAYNCEAVGCKIEMLGPSEGFCATATEFKKETLPQGYQMCCTQNAVIKLPASKDEIIMCNRLTGEVFNRNKELEKDGSRYPDYCCTANADSCAAHTSNSYNEEQVACNAFRAVKFPNADRNKWGVACTNNKCYKALVVPGEKLACKRFYGLPVAANDLRSLEQAIAVLRLNTELHAESANTYDSETLRKNAERNIRDLSAP